MHQFRLFSALLLLAAYSTFSSGGTFPASGFYDFSAINFEFLPSTGHYDTSICIPMKNSDELVGDCALETTLRAQLDTDESDFLSLSMSLRISMIAMSLMKAMENYQKVTCGSGTCCSSNRNALAIKKRFIAVYLAMGLAHLLEDQINGIISIVTDYSYRLYHLAMLTVSLVARAIDCDCRHPWINRHVGMIAIHALMLFSPFSLIH